VGLSIGYLMGGLVNIRRALPVICLLLVGPVIGAAEAACRPRTSQRSSVCIPGTKKLGFRVTQMGCVFSSRRTACCFRRTETRPRIGRILVSAGCSANPNHKAGRNAAKYRRRWGDRLCLGHGRSGMDHGAEWQDQERIAQRYLLERSPQASEWRVDDVASYLG
jgi:hypothetical protein